jgi:hypothetical protein
VPQVAVNISPVEETRPGEPRGSLAAAGVLLLGILLCFLGAWYHVRQGRRAGQMPVSAGSAPTQEKPARSAAAGPPLAVRCPECGHNLKARVELAGKRVKCPQCGAPVLLPSMTAHASARQT